MSAPARSPDAVVIGGGASGCMAAGRAAERGRRVLLLEGNRAIGSKLLITGKGRCNLTNVKGRALFIDEFGPSGKFLHNVFSRFFNDDLVAFFEKRGVRLKAERGGRVFPASDDSRDVVKALLAYLDENGVAIRCRSRVTDVATAGGRVTGVEIDGAGSIAAGRVVLATGGLSYPDTGSTGAGHAIARRLGHTIVDVRPALVPIETREPIAKEWQGVSLKAVRCSLLDGDKEIASKFGEMLFTHFGVSGPIILDMSRSAGDLLAEGKKAVLRINFKPALSADELESKLLREFSAMPNASIRNLFKQILPARIANGFVSAAGVDGTTKVHQITRGQRSKLLRSLMDFRLTVVRTRPIEEAIVTAGGVATREIDPGTMESRLVKGLYIVGELIDIDAPTGGYNLQAAFSTGYVCGENL